MYPDYGVVVVVVTVERERPKAEAVGFRMI